MREMMKTMKTHRAHARVSELIVKYPIWMLKFVNNTSKNNVRPIRNEIMREFCAQHCCWFSTPVAIISWWFLYALNDELMKFTFVMKMNQHKAQKRGGRSDWTLYSSPPSSIFNFTSLELYFHCPSVRYVRDMYAVFHCWMDSGQTKGDEMNISALREKMFVKQIKRRFHYVHFNHHYWDASEGDWRDHQKNENLSQFSLIFPSSDENHHCRLDLALFCVIERITNHYDVVECVRNQAWKWHVRFTQWKNVNFPFISHIHRLFFCDDKKFAHNFHPVWGGSFWSCLICK